MTDLKLNLRRELPEDSQAVEKLHERAFGPGRFARTAFRLREGVPPVANLSFTASVGTLIVGSVRLTEVRVTTGEKVLMLGPLTVDPAFHDRGIGAALMRLSLDAARDDGYRLVILVGDEPYYSRFGFKVVPSGRLKLPGPVDDRRFLYCPLVSDAIDSTEGMVLPAA
ncbi:MAG: N-acetyltransferase [Chelatococcus sp.]|jgi:predicted N-acetyltransferase YhbS|uniref:GNAT family N-acetyltransferase n=1 Tax=Chelatococcus sp. TaxID=1953771 RepID=UPI0025C4C1C9|nr:N-acetyltransferase [Chelatococcus sp.]MBX3539619.1 N-acetyltransferase [Chelatococcus sp.]